MTSQTQSLDELTATLEALAQRVKMQRVRNAVTHAERDNSKPDPYKDPNGWRQAMNRKLALGRIATPEV